MPPKLLAKLLPPWPVPTLPRDGPFDPEEIDPPWTGGSFWGPEALAAVRANVARLADTARAAGMLRWEAEAVLAGWVRGNFARNLEAFGAALELSLETTAAQEARLVAREIGRAYGPGDDPDDDPHTHTHTDPHPHPET